MLRAILLMIGLGAGFGCATQPANPAFPLTPADAHTALDDMRESPKPLPRPLVVLGGYLDPGIGPALYAADLRRLTQDDRITSVSFAFSRDFDETRRKVIAAVDEAFPTDDPEETVEVDVVALSMGGVVARHAAMPVPGQRRLKIARLFTIASPHRGAKRAEWPTFIQLQRDMRAGSEFLTALNRCEEEDYELVAYVRLGDDVIGPENAAPQGQTPYWLPNLPLQTAHAGAMRDPRILADIARRLRGEEPFTHGPPAPLPEPG